MAFSLEKSYIQHPKHKNYMPSNNVRTSFRGKQFLITYPQCDLDHQAIWDKCLQHGATGAVVASELHQDGGAHRHAYVEFASRKEFGSRSFDIRGFHPNIQSCRDATASREYVKKDGQFTEFGQLSAVSLGELDPRNFTSEELWLRQCLQAEIPFGYAQRLWDLSQQDDTFTILDGTVTNEDYDARVDGRLLIFDYDFRSNRSLVLEGPSGCGKTTWAKYHAPKPSLFVTHMDTLKKFRPTFHKSIIFDDMSFTHLPRESQIHIVDQENPRSIHVRYGTATIPANTAKIFTCNQAIFTEDPAIRRRIRRYFIQ